MVTLILHGMTKGSPFISVEPKASCLKEWEDELECFGLMLLQSSSNDKQASVSDFVGVL